MLLEFGEHNKMTNLNFNKFNFGTSKYGTPIVKIKKPWKTFREFGSEFEKKVQRDLKKKGYAVSKPHNKHYDIHAVKGGKTYIVECKCNQAGFSQDEVNEAIKCSARGDIYMIARQNWNGRIVYIKNLGTKKYHDDKRERQEKARKSQSNKSFKIPTFKMPKFKI